MNDVRVVDVIFFLLLHFFLFVLETRKNKKGMVSKTFLCSRQHVFTGLPLAIGPTISDFGFYQFKSPITFLEIVA